MSNIDKQALREEFQFMRGIYSDPADHERQLIYIAAEALLDELESAEKKAVEMPTFDGYVPHVARELQAAFRIACDNAGINIAAAAGKGD